MGTYACDVEEFVKQKSLIRFDSIRFNSIRTIPGFQLGSYAAVADAVLFKPMSATKARDSVLTKSIRSLGSGTTTDTEARFVPLACGMLIRYLGLSGSEKEGRHPMNWSN